MLSGWSCREESLHNLKGSCVNNVQVHVPVCDVCTCVSMYVCMRVCVCGHTCVCTCVGKVISGYAHVHTMALRYKVLLESAVVVRCPTQYGHYEFNYTHIHMHVRTHAHTYTYTYIHTHIHTK